ncbi:MAG: tRNA epoxyqueuosine(34) reductase QueG [Pyrinomonadaceae bacterium]
MQVERNAAELIKAQALIEGFHKVGIARAEALTSERRHLEAWLARGFNASMEWMARDIAKRTDPHHLLPDAKSIIVVALNYFTPHTHEEVRENCETTFGKLSRYCWGDDYHDVIGSKLKSLLSWIKEEWPQAEGKVCVDAQPAMDKAWAVRAGFGWIGKHSNLITRDFGSWVFIGELILNLELEPEPERVEDHCGSCTLCIDSCPTHAIIDNRLIDAGKCISYATIESRDEELPSSVSEDLNGWLYGCDICQEVCPWNRFEQPTNEARFEPRNGETSLPLEDVLNITHEEYTQRFRRSSVKRAKLSGLKRNARALITTTF